MDEGPYARERSVYCVFLAAPAHNAPPQSRLRRASSTFYGIAATGSYVRFNSLRDAPPVGEAFLPFYISPRKVSTSLRMSRGLLRWAFMPALRERRTSSSKALAVRATMGKASVSGRWRARMAWAAS